MPRWGRATSGRPLVIGHRGASAREPENSVAAFRRAAADGADGVELDVLQCRSGEVVVFHDDDLRRLGGRPDAVAELPWSELRALRLLSGAALPTLEEAFLACGPDLLVNVELKAGRVVDPTIAPLVDAVARVVERLGVEARVLVSSFHPLAVRAWQRRLPAVPCALLFEPGSALPLRRAWALPWLQPFAAHPEHSLCTPGRVASWHDAGYVVNVWTVDAPERLRALRGMGVDGIITNDPAAARSALV